MNREEIIRRLKNIAEHVVCTVGEPPFVMSLDDGIALHEAIDILNRGPEIVTCKECIHRPKFSKDYDPDAVDSIKVDPPFPVWREEMAKSMARRGYSLGEIGEYFGIKESVIRSVIKEENDDGE